MPRASVRACARRLSIAVVLSLAFKGGVVCTVAAAAPARRVPLCLAGWGTRAYPPCSCVPAGTRLGERTGPCGLSVPNTEQGGGETPRDAPGLEAAECGLGGAVAAPSRPRVRWPGAGTQPVETFVAGTPLLRAFGANTTAKLTERVGRALVRHACAHTAQPRLSPRRGHVQGGRRGPAPGFRWFWARWRGAINQSDQRPLPPLPSPLSCGPCGH